MVLKMNRCICKLSAPKSLHNLQGSPITYDMQYDAIRLIMIFMAQTHTLVSKVLVYIILIPFLL